MERKKSALSGLFNAVNALENVLLAVMVIGMIVTILLQIRRDDFDRSSIPMDRGDKPLSFPLDDVCGIGCRI